jgi:valyl-tRNA synthetase
LPRANQLPPQAELSLADRWILTELHRTVVRVTEAFDRYEFGVAADALLDFMRGTVLRLVHRSDEGSERRRAPPCSRTR